MNVSIDLHVHVGLKKKGALLNISVQVLIYDGERGNSQDIPPAYQIVTIISMQPLDPSSFAVGPAQ